MGEKNHILHLYHRRTVSIVGASTCVPDPKIIFKTADGVDIASERGPKSLETMRAHRPSITYRVRYIADSGYYGDSFFICSMPSPTPGEVWNLAFLPIFDFVGDGTPSSPRLAIGVGGVTRTSTDAFSSPCIPSLKTRGVEGETTTLRVETDVVPKSFSGSRHFRARGIGKLISSIKNLGEGFRDGGRRVRRWGVLLRAAGFSMVDCVSRSAWRRR